MTSEIGWHSNNGHCKLQCNATSEIRSALLHHVLQVTMKCDIRNPICAPTPVIASYYKTGHQKSDCTPTTGIDSYCVMGYQKSDLHSNTWYCELLRNATSEIRSALQHHVLQVTMK